MPATTAAVELTMQMVRFAQAPPGPPQSPAFWTVVPDTRRHTYTTACARLAALNGPVIVAPLQGFGTIGVWSSQSFDDAERKRFDYHIKNQQGFLEDSLSNFAHADAAARVLFETAGDQFTLSVAELRLWAAQFALHCGWTLGEGPDRATPLRLLARRADGEWSPGMSCRPPGPAKQP